MINHVSDEEGSTASGQTYCSRNSSRPTLDNRSMVSSQLRPGSSQHAGYHQHRAPRGLHHHLARPASAGVQRKHYDRCVRSGSAGRESGFQSSMTSMTSLDGGGITALTGSCGLGQAPSDSMASLTSGISSFHLASTHSPVPSVSGRRSSLTRLSNKLSSSRISLGRRSARNFVASREGVKFAQFRPVQWFLKPIFHEVPQRDSCPMFVGRRWVWSEMSERMRSDERGVMIVGGPGCGKTALSL